MAESWAEEFRREIQMDHQALMDKAARDCGRWDFLGAVERTRRFYRERIGGFAGCLSVSAPERDALLRMVERLGTPDFGTKS